MDQTKRSNFAWGNAPLIHVQGQRLWWKKTARANACLLRQRNKSPLKPQSRPSVIRSARPASITELAAWSSLAVPLLHQLTNAIQCGGEWICTAIVIHPKVYLPIREALKIIEGLAVCV